MDFYADETKSVNTWTELYYEGNGSMQKNLISLSAKEMGVYDMAEIMILQLQE